MTAARASRGAAGCFAAALLLAVLAVLSGVSAARGAELSDVDLSFRFDDMAPGETRTDTRAFEIPVDALIRAAEVEVDHNDDGAFSWVVQVCPVGGGGCAVVDAAAVGTALAAGDYLLTVTVAVGSGAPAVASSAISGYLSFVEDDGGDLPPTGWSAVWLAVAVVVFTVAGLGLLRLARRARPACEVAA